MMWFLYLKEWNFVILELYIKLKVIMIREKRVDIKRNIFYYVICKYNLKILFF